MPSCRRNPLALARGGYQSKIGCGLVTITRDEVSATLARKYVLDNDFLNFSKVVIGKNKYNIFNQIRVYYDQIKKTHIT